jgi:hypothetical protein
LAGPRADGRAMQGLSDPRPAQDSARSRTQPPPGTKLPTPRASEAPEKPDPFPSRLSVPAAETPLAPTVPRPSPRRSRSLSCCRHSNSGVQLGGGVPESKYVPANFDYLSNVLAVGQIGIESGADETQGPAVWMGRTPIHTAKGLSCISNSQRQNEGAFGASELAGIEPTPPAPKEAGYVRHDHSATLQIVFSGQFNVRVCPTAATPSGPKEAKSSPCRSSSSPPCSTWISGAKRETRGSALPTFPIVRKAHERRVRAWDRDGSGRVEPRTAASVNLPAC